MSSVMLLFIIIFQTKYSTILADSTVSVSDQAHVFQLSSLEPSCTQGVINSFNYAADVSNVIRIVYTCTANSAIGEVAITKRTLKNRSAAVNMHYLDRHFVDCGSGYAISSFSVQNDGCSIWYAYKCRTITELSCTMITTREFAGNAGKFAGFKFFYFLKCPNLGTGVENTAIQSFQMFTAFNNIGTGMLKYTYKLCTILFCDIACNGCYSSYNPNKCIACATDKGYYPLIDNMKKCVNTPQLGYYLSANIYLRCLPQCLSCSGGGVGEDHQCTECAAFTVQSPIIPTSCICPIGYFINLNPPRCDKCYISCGTCKELGTYSDNKCISCATNYYSLENTSQCVDICPLGFYPDELTKQCLRCVKLSPLCSECFKEFFLFAENNSCVSVCPERYFKNETKRTCDKCPVECLTCQTGDLCSTCVQGLMLVKNKCVDKCPDGFYQDSPLSCKPCSEGCRACTNGAQNGCLSCTDSFPFLSQGRCISKCLIGEISLLQEGKCFNVSACINFFNMNVPTRFNLDQADFTTKISMELTTECEQYRTLIEYHLTYQWVDTFLGILSEGNTILTIAAKNLRADIKTFTVNISLNTLPLFTLTKDCQFKNNKLVPVVKNINSLSFVFGYPILIDASLSFDEGLIDGAVTSNIDDPDLIFQWMCTTEISAICRSYKDRKLKLSSQDYSGLKENIQKVLEYSTTIILKLMKGNRTATVDINIVISNPFFGIEIINATNATSSNTTNQTSPVSKKNYEKLITISPRGRGIKQEDLIFETKFIDEKIDKNNFGYYWTLETIIDESIYMNGRKEDVLRIPNDKVAPGKNLITLKFYENDNPTVEYFKNYTYIKVGSPYGGNCYANPMMGFSLETEITFSAQGWLSSNLPLSYNFYMLTQKGIHVPLVDDIIPLSVYTTSIIPVGTEFYVDITDSTGLMVTSSCLLTIEKYTHRQNTNQKKLVLKDMLDKISSTKKRLLLIIAFNSNDFPLDLKTIEESASMLKSLVDSSKQPINNNMDIILSQLDSISTIKSQTTSVKNIVDQVINSVLDNLGSIIQNSKKIEELINIIGNFYDQSKSPNAGTNSTAERIKFDNYINTIQLQLSANIVPGQVIIFSNKKFSCQVGKISRRNFKAYAIVDDSRLDSDRVILRMLQQNENECESDAAVCLSSDTLKNITAESHGETVIISRLNKDNSLLPILEESFSNTSLSLNIVQIEQSTLRFLSRSHLTMSYTVRLKAPYLNSTTIHEKINDTACVQYDEKLIADSTSCTTWYDYDTMEIVCICIKQGLTVNVFDKSFSSFSKLAQFPALTGELINVYSLSIVGCLIFLLLILLGIGHYKDKQDEIKKRYIAFDHFDLMQYYLIQYTKEGFHKNYTLMSLYWYVIKTNHPIISIISIYSVSYYRVLRVLDFFLNLYISFFFTFLPLYATDNQMKILNENSRSVRNIGLGFDELGLSVQQLIDGILYSVFSSIISTILTIPLTFLLYSDVIKEESEKRQNAMENIVRYYIRKRKANYMEKVRNGVLKIKTFHVLMLLKNKPQGSTPSRMNMMEIVHPISPPKKSQMKIEAKKKRSKKETSFEEEEKSHRNESFQKNTSFSRSDSRSKIFLLQNLPTQKRTFSQQSFEKEDEKFITGYPLIISKAECLEFLSSSSPSPYITGKPIYDVREGTRIYLFQIPKDFKFQVSCTYFRFCRTKILSNGPIISKKILSIVKISIILGLDIFILIYLLVFILGIYKNFGKQIVQLCILPVISVFIIKLVIISCLMLFIATLLMFYYGPQIYSQKAFSLKALLFNVIVPPIASSHHHAILLFRTIQRTYK